MINFVVIPSRFSNLIRNSSLHIQPFDAGHQHEFTADLASWAATSIVSEPQAMVLARNAFVDVIACMIAGASSPATRRAGKMASAFSHGSSPMIGNRADLPAIWAAFVGGTAAHALDFDDNFAPATTHATAVLAPALFALAGECDASGEDVTKAYIKGLEVQARIGRHANPSHYERGWHATSTIGTIGVAAACAVLLKLPATGILGAISAATSMASGSKRQFGSDLKPVHAGLAAKNGVLAARLAEAGLAGNEEPLTGRWGFFDLFGDSGRPIPRDDAQQGSDALAICKDGLLAKIYPCCGAAHRTLDGISQLRARLGGAIERVVKVEALIPSYAYANLRYTRPETPDQARFSLPYCGARLLVAGALTLEDFGAQRLRDPVIHPWLERFSIEIAPGSVSEELGRAAKPAITRFYLTNGEMMEVGISAPSGSLDRPLTQAEIRRKFSDCCRWAGLNSDNEVLFSRAHELVDQQSFGEAWRSFLRVLRKTTPTGVAA